MYHSIAADAETGVEPYFQVRTSPTRFAEHMQWVADLGYRAVSLREGLSWLDQQRAGPASVPDACRLVAVTFDDGFQDFLDAAFPVLQRHGFSATMYLPTAFIGEERKTFKGHTCLTWGEVRELDAADIEFGSHTVNHPRLTDLPWLEIESELRDSKGVIEQQLGRAVQSFAYPYAFPQENRRFAKRFRALLERSGYLSSVTTTIGRVHCGSDLHELPRLPANSVDDRQLLEAKLAGGYDWVALPQMTHKHAKRCLRYFSQRRRLQQDKED